MLYHCIARTVLNRIVSHVDMHHIPLLVIVTKTDVPNSIPLPLLTQRLSLSTIPHASWAHTHNRAGKRRASTTTVRIFKPSGSPSIDTSNYSYSHSSHCSNSSGSSITSKSLSDLDVSSSPAILQPSPSLPPTTTSSSQSPSLSSETTPQQTSETQLPPSTDSPATTLATTDQSLTDTVSSTLTSSSSSSDSKCTESSSSSSSFSPSTSSSTSSISSEAEGMVSATTGATTEPFGYGGGPREWNIMTVNGRTGDGLWPAMEWLRLAVSRNRAPRARP
jgi:hypothetical protein